LSRREPQQRRLRQRRDLKDGLRPLTDEGNDLAVERFIDEVGSGLCRCDRGVQRKVLIGASDGFNVASYRA
jgi:hypothetical protein